jgi:hypothetical protein
MAAPAAMEARRLRLESIAFIPLSARTAAFPHVRSDCQEHSGAIRCCLPFGADDFVAMRLARTIGGLWKRFSIGPNAI